ncbi:LPXTG cell wall anchor domain-containing protein [Vagococcus zengguangii]|uniref:LPXTG cell wall anchor domain-containing protein n=1 Tax=Vagococcus zengguangii TaxID=2571750 RepID=A0A4D7CU99_9ENTE|nr:LPXTG cell wall anchor domain-containing protein [Vagococcus zengguangii]QCI86883.1 LPXTG cell wall anchor domain-containing protein [Vagococcus zengguangii]TLG80489.1 LPXTG cell wall anchor domain-containing protein [Vagococcus zengguangii]
MKKMSLVLAIGLIISSAFSPFMSAAESQSSIRFYKENKAPIVVEETITNFPTDENIPDNSFTNDRDSVNLSEKQENSSLTSDRNQTPGYLPKTGFRQSKLVVLMGLIVIIIALIIKKKEGKEHEKN